MKTSRFWQVLWAAIPTDDADALADAQGKPSRFALVETRDGSEPIGAISEVGAPDDDAVWLLCEADGDNVVLSAV